MLTLPHLVIVLEGIAQLVPGGRHALRGRQVVGCRASSAVSRCRLRQARTAAEPGQGSRRPPRAALQWSSNSTPSLPRCEPHLAVAAPGREELDEVDLRGAGSKEAGSGLGRQGWWWRWRGAAAAVRMLRTPPPPSPGPHARGKSSLQQPPLLSARVPDWAAARARLWLGGVQHPPCRRRSSPRSRRRSGGARGGPWRPARSRPEPTGAGRGAAWRGVSAAREAGGSRLLKASGGRRRRAGGHLQLVARGATLSATSARSPSFRRRAGRPLAQAAAGRQSAAATGAFWPPAHLDQPWRLCSVRCSSDRG